MGQNWGAVPSGIRIQQEKLQQQFMLISENWLDKAEPRVKLPLLGLTIGGDGAHLL